MSSRRDFLKKGAVAGVGASTLAGLGVRTQSRKAIRNVAGT
jgi:hypothetical protein